MTAIDDMSPGYDCSRCNLCCQLVELDCVGNALDQRLRLELRFYRPETCEVAARLLGQARCIGATEQKYLYPATWAEAVNSKVRVIYVCFPLRIRVRFYLALHCLRYD